MSPPPSQRQSILYYCDYDDGRPSIVDDHDYNEDDEENEDDDGDLNWSHPPHSHPPQRPSLRRLDRSKFDDGKRERWVYIDMDAKRIKILNLLLLKLFLPGSSLTKSVHTWLSPHKCLTKIYICSPSPLWQGIRSDDRGRLRLPMSGNEHFL